MNRFNRGRAPRVNHHLVAAACRDRPGEWVRVAEYRALYTAKAMVVTVAGRGWSGTKIRAYRPSGAFEARYEENPDGDWVVFARYVGEPLPL